MLATSALVMTDGNGHKSWLSQAASAIVVIGIGHKPQQQTRENKHCPEQQWFDH